MSRAAKLTLAAASVASVCIISGVHYMQWRERDSMHRGVLRDEERRKEKMRQREEDLQRSIQRREIYERVQTVSSSSRTSNTDSPV